MPQELAAAGPVQGVYWLPALDHEGDLLAMDLPAWREALRVRVKSLFHTMRTLYEQIAAAGNVPGFGDAARRTARIRRSRSGRTARWSGRWDDQDLQAGDGQTFSSRQSISNRDAMRRHLPRFLSRRLCAIPARSRSATKKASAGPSACRNNPPRMASRA